MKKIGIYISFAALLFSSCEDMLDTVPKDFLSPDTYEKEADIIYALNGTYKALTGMTLTGVDGQNIEPMLTDFVTDNGCIDKSWMGVLEYWDQGHNQFSAFTEKKWARNYIGILRANTMLTYMDQVNLSEASSLSYQAQARFLRAYFYADLAHYYGDVPMRLQPDGIEDKDLARTPVDSILDFVYEELDFAMANLPLDPSDTDSGRATKGAAQALKAWVALNRYDYEMANAMCDSIIEGGQYSIFSDYANLFKPEYENNAEVIFDIQYLSNMTDYNLSEPWTTYFYAWSSYMADYSLFSQYYMTNGLPADETNPEFNSRNPFENRDPRLEATLCIPYAANGYTDVGEINYYIPYNKSAYNFSSVRINKWVDYNVEHAKRGTKSTGTNAILSRYADILLIKAEALCMLYGSARETEIAALVNQVRNRASVMMPKVEDAEGTGLSQDELMDIIMHERRVEFAYEGTRILDIKRWDIGEEAYSDGRGYNPNLLYYWVVNEDNYAEMEEAGVPSTMLRYLTNTSYFMNKIFKSEELFQAQLEAVFTTKVVDAETLAYYTPIIIGLVEPRYEVYTFRTRSFNSTKGYLWAIPYNEMQTNELITTNNPGY